MGHSAWPNAHYVINTVGKFNAQRRHRIDPVKDCASQQLQRPISDNHTTAAITSTMITIKIGVSSMVRSPRANLIEMDI